MANHQKGGKNKWQLGFQNVTCPHVNAHDSKRLALSDMT